jgi:thiol-disulfide isomerase/thioredoxin
MIPLPFSGIAVRTRAFIATVLLVMTMQDTAAKPLDSRPAPEFTQTSPDAWINSPPLTSDAFRGKVTLVDFWTFGCWNCYRSFPWLNALEKRMEARDFQVIGIHTPEFDHEKVRDSVIRKTREFGLEHPVMMDNDFSFWNAFNNRYWPAFYLVDKQGNLRHLFVGETHDGSRKARQVEAAIEALLAEE